MGVRMLVRASGALLRLWSVNKITEQMDDLAHILSLELGPPPELATFATIATTEGRT